MMLFKKEFTCTKGVNFTAYEGKKDGYVINNSTGVKRYYNNTTMVESVEKFIELYFNVNDVYSLNDWQENK